MAAIKKRNVTEEIIQWVEDQIEQQVWTPGQQISSENALAVKFGVNRTSVRYAIRQLVAVGVLESFQGKGTFVKKISMEEIGQKLNGMYVDSQFRQLLEYRKIIECASCRIAAEHLNDGIIAKMEDACAEMRKNRTNKKEFIENDLKFHLYILKTTENDIIVKSMDLIWDEIERQHFFFNGERSVAKAIYFHENILEAFKERDGDRASRLMAEHIDALINQNFD